jgi:hypothetical protein
MNTEHIISLARKAGWGFNNSRDSDFVKAQLCFAKLVAAEEREACAKFIEHDYVRQFERPWRDDLSAAIRARGQA